MFKKYKTGEIVEYTLCLIAVICLFLFIYLNMSIELRDPDIWLHLKTGEYIVQHKIIPRQDTFSATMSGKNWIDHSWLVQVIFYLVFHFGGPDNLILLSGIVVILAFLFLFLSVYGNRQHLILLVIMLFATVFASRIRFNIRPENFSVLFFALYLFLLTKGIRKKWIYSLALIQLLWVNSHGFFILGPLMLLVFIAGEKLKRAKLLPWEWNDTDVLDDHSFKNLKRAFFLVCLACFFNPYGYRGLFYPFWVTFNSLGKSSIFYRYIQELLPVWQTPSQLGINISPYYALVMISLSAFLFTFRRTNIAYLILWLIFLGISLRINRNIIYFNFFAFLSTTDTLIKRMDLKKFDFISEFFGRSVNLLKHLIKYIVIIFIILVIIKNISVILKSGYYIFEENISKSSLLGISLKRYPEKATDFIAKNNLPGNIFNQFNYGSYAIYRLYPKIKVFIDGRTELYGEDFFKNYKRILGVDTQIINGTFRKYDINTALLSASDLEIIDLAKYLFYSPDWVLVYFDEESLIFLKNTFQNQMLISKFKLDLKNRQVTKADLNKIGMKNVFPEPYIKRAWIFFYLGLDEQAISEAREALRIKPSVPDAYIVLGRIYTKKRLFDEAYENLRLANIYGGRNRETLISLGNFYKEGGKLKEAIQVYRRLVKFYPYFAEGYYLLGRGYKQINDITQAIKSTQAAIKLNPFRAQYYKELGELFCKNNDLRKAADIYQKAIEAGLDKEEFSRLPADIEKKQKE